MSQSPANLSHALALLAICFVIHFLVANLITPKILGSKVDLNATASTVALVFWGEIWGGIGLLLAIPITAILKILLQHSGNSKLHWFAILMSEDPDSLIHQTNRQILSQRTALDRIGKKLWK